MIKIKHNPRITILLLVMFLIAQLIGIYVVNHYAPTKIVDGEQINVTSPDLPFGLETPEVEEQNQFNYLFVFILAAFVIAISLMLLLTKFKAEFFIKLWFFLVIVIALGISINVFIPEIKYSMAIVLAISLPLAFLKVYRRNFLVHNTTELLIYPGIAAVFVPILNIYTIVALLLLISIYDMWAVWHSGIMQKMAKYQIDTLNIFSGFFVPYMSKTMRSNIKKMKKEKKKSELRKKKIKVNVAILGGGDVVFPIITAGVMLKTLGIFSALSVSVGATLGLAFLFFRSEKKKFYPAMPFITAGILMGIGVSYLFYFVF